MRSSFSRVVPAIVVTLLVAGCTSAPSPAPTLPSRPSAPSGSPSTAAVASPIVTLAPNPTAEPPAGASGWPYTLDDADPVFGPDGTVYFLTRDAAGAYQRVAGALDTAGHVKPGWPMEAPSGSDFGSLTVGADGTVYMEERGGPTVGNLLHRFDALGRDLPGWPFDMPADFTCPDGAPYNTDDPRTPAVDDPCYPPRVDVAANGVAYLTNHRATGPLLLAIHPSGTIVPGWPVSLDDKDWSLPQLGPDGSVYLVGRPTGTPTYHPTRGVIDTDAKLWALGPNGTQRSGWPVPVPNIRGFLIGPNGDVVVSSLIDDVGELCSNPRRTVFTVIGPDGQIRPGWPRGSTGHASSPVVGADGTVYYVSATAKVYAHDRAGEVKSGWPLAVPGASNGCGPENPHLAPSGTVHVVGDEVYAASPDGGTPAGWPHRPAGELVAPCIDSECIGGHEAPVFGPDGTVYLLTYQTDAARVRAEVIAIDPRGQLKPGWPFRVPFDPKTAGVGVSVSPDGRIFVRGGDQLLALDPDGSISN
jgi:outer membrane protein assembly factor BamB